MEAALYLIPVTLGETEISQVLPPYNHEKLKNKNQDLKVSLKKSRDKNEEMINSTSWKITKPLRMPKQYLSKRKSS